MLNLNNKLNSWKTSLLDLSKRNRLLSFKETVRSSLYISEPSAYECYNALVQQKKSLYFDTSETHKDNKNIKTAQSGFELRKTLTTLRNKARTAFEEQGVDTLYLVLGFVRWKEDKINEVSTPLLLLPCILLSESAGTVFRLKSTEEDLVTNPTLLHKFRTSFNMRIPLFEEDTDFKEYMDSVRQVLEDNEQLDKYVSVIRNNKISSGMRHNLQCFTRRTGSKVQLKEPTKNVTVEGLVPVPAGRFQILEVNETASIKDFLEEHGVEFKAGRTFYELKKTETVQQYKEIILEDNATGELYYGEEAREYLKLLPQCLRADEYASEKLKPARKGEYTVFIQSTSYNRKLPKDSRVLYEVPDFE